MERLDHFMARANAGYYATRDPFRDFTTAPEITQVFGEVLGLWAAVTWEMIGRPDPVLLVEAGPGRGTLMADALRAIDGVAPDFAAALHLHLIETSPRLRAIQAGRLANARWHDGLATLPAAPVLLVANEFLDALPIRQFVQRGDAWHERYVEDGRFVECPSRTPRPLRGRGRDAPATRVREPPHAPSPGADPGVEAQGQALSREAETVTVYEACEAALDIAAALGARLNAAGGAALFLDYGPEHSTPGDSLQALRDGRPGDPLADPGSADLTAHVDFARFAQAARDAGAATHGPLPQGIFLTRLGLFQRTDRLARTQPPARALALIDAARRLVEPNRMGRLFKALAICHPSCPPPPGFEAAP